jgi:ribosomal protein L13E
MKQRLGRGFTIKELLAGGVHGQNYARSLGISVDRR